MSKRASVSKDTTGRSTSSTDLTAMRSPTSALGVDSGDFVVVPTREEKRKQRKKEQKPSFQFDTSYFRMGKHIGVAHVRDLILYITADAQKPGWIVPEHKNHISHTVVLFVPGLLPSVMNIAPVPVNATLPFPLISLDPERDDEFSIPYIRKLFTYGCPVRAPGDQRRLHSVTNTLLSCPLPEAARKKKEEQNRKIAAVAKADSTSPLIYLLTPNQMIDNDYHLPSYIQSSDDRCIPGLDLSTLPKEVAALLEHPPRTESDASLESYIMPKKEKGSAQMTDKEFLDWQLLVDPNEGYVETPQAKDQPENALYPILAMDCEMVVTDDGQELARVSVIDFQSGVNIFDEFVKPGKPVTDYRTQWSGITPEKLAGAKHTLQSIQEALVTGPSAIIKPHTILLGHSLECDLNALKIRHPLCIDTAIIFKHPRGPPYKPGLKWLAQRWMGQEIQNSAHGHDSEEDARACVGLLKLKMANGPDFGSFTDTNESIFERIGRSIADPVTKEPRKTAFCDYGNPRAGHGARATTVTKCINDDEVVDAMIKNAEDHDFVFGRLTELSNIMSWNAPKSNNVPGSDVPLRQPVPTVATGAFELNQRLKRLHTALPSNTALIVLNGHSDPKPMLELAARRHKWERLVKTAGGFEGIPKEERWLSEHDRELEEKVAEARVGMAFFCVKR